VDPAPLIKAVKDPSSFVREAVAVALGQIGTPAATEALQNLTKDDVPQVRDAALAALKRHP
jgi:HEAT repeat protein